MPGTSRRIFRTKALERISSPENLDQLVEVVGPRDWLPITVLGGLIVLILIWAVTGRIPTTVSGRGILIHAGRVLEVQALGAGRIETLAVRPGDRVEAGHVLARVDLFELKRKLAEDETLLAKLETQDRASRSVQNDRTRLQKQQTGQQAMGLEAQAVKIRRSLEQARVLTPLLDARLEGLRALRERGLLASAAPEMVEAEKMRVDNEQLIATLTGDLAQLDVQLTQARVLEAEVARVNVESDAVRQTGLQELRARISVTQLQLDRDSVIVASQAGQVVDVSAAPGRVIAAGERIATIEIDGPTDGLTSVSYFAIGDGKKIRPGMPVQVIPDNVERERFGGITGTVIAVATLPATAEGARAVLGNAEAAQALLQGGPRLEVTAKLDHDTTTASGYRWSSSRGPAIAVTPGVTSAVRVTVEQRSPISYLLPFLRELAGVY